MFLRDNVANGAPFAVGGERSTMHRLRFDTVPELVACAADVGRTICNASCLDIVTFVAVENEGFRIPGPPSMPSMPSSSTVSAAKSSCFFSSPGDNLSNGVGANEELPFDVSETYTGARSFCD